MIELYHGSNAIVEKPLVNVGRKELDFSPGFIKILPDYDNDWLDFIVASRTGQKPWLNYDIIEGGVANDQVIDTVEDYFSGRITSEQAIGQLKYAHPSHQICIRRQNIVDNFLHYQGTVIVK